LKYSIFGGEVRHNSALIDGRTGFPDVLLSNVFGPAEITVDCTYFIVQRDFKDDEPLPIGFPCQNSDVLILNEVDKPCRVYERGELCVRGSSLALGYWNDPEKTAQAFVQNPLQNAYPDILYRTGDIVYRNKRNEIMFVSRRDDQIKYLGYRIELGEIETAVSALPEMDRACVLYDRSKQAITLFFQASRKLEAGSIRRTLSRNLPKYMLPQVIHQFDQLPLNSNGKVDRRRLIDQYALDACS